MRDSPPPYNRSGFLRSSKNTLKKDSRSAHPLGGWRQELVIGYYSINL
ncbi:MAG: hypothetical protein ABWJ42_00620 [Sulfolobales archaeon]